MEFTGFTQEQFQVFAVEGFAERMLGIKQLVRPSLVALGEQLSEPLSAVAGHRLYPHVALHARRRVNPPPETWVAFGREQRGYKAYSHFAVGISQEGIWVGMVIKDESDDRAVLGQQLLKKPAAAAKSLRELKDFELPELTAPKVTSEAIRKLGDTLAHRKTATFHLIRPFAAADPRLAEAPAMVELAVETCRQLLPWYCWSLG